MAARLEPDIAVPLGGDGGYPPGDLLAPGRELFLRRFRGGARFQLQGTSEGVAGVSKEPHDIASDEILEPRGAGKWRTVGDILPGPLRPPFGAGVVMVLLPPGGGGAPDASVATLGAPHQAGEEIAAVPDPVAVALVALQRLLGPLPEPGGQDRRDTSRLMGPPLALTSWKPEQAP